MNNCLGLHTVVSTLWPLGYGSIHTSKLQPMGCEHIHTFILQHRNTTLLSRKFTFENCAIKQKKQSHTQNKSPTCFK